MDLPLESILRGTHFAGLHFPPAAATVSTAAACRRCLCFRSYAAIVSTDAAISVATAATRSPGAAVDRAALKVVSVMRRRWRGDGRLGDQFRPLSCVKKNSALDPTVGSNNFTSTLSCRLY
jgi:hypothetical protein